MPKKHADCSDEELLQMLEARTKMNGYELEKGMPGRANKQFRIMANLSRELMLRGSSAHQEILRLLDSDHPYVRAWAAFLAFEIDPTAAEGALEKLIQNSSRGLRFDARFTLQLWRKGQLRTLSQWDIGT